MKPMIVAVICPEDSGHLGIFFAATFRICVLIAEMDKLTGPVSIRGDILFGHKFP